MKMATLLVCGFLVACATAAADEPSAIEEILSAKANTWTAAHEVAWATYTDWRIYLRDKYGFADFVFVCDERYPESYDLIFKDSGYVRDGVSLVRGRYRIDGGKWVRLNPLAQGTYGGSYLALTFGPKPIGRLLDASELEVVMLVRWPIGKKETWRFWLDTTEYKTDTFRAHVSLTGLSAAWNTFPKQCQYPAKIPD